MHAFRPQTEKESRPARRQIGSLVSICRILRGSDPGGATCGFPCAVWASGDRDRSEKLLRPVRRTFAVSLRRGVIREPARPKANRLPYDSLNCQNCSPLCGGTTPGEGLTEWETLPSSTASSSFIPACLKPARKKPWLRG